MENGDRERMGPDGGPRTPRLRTSRSGFTLLEMVVVLAILVVLAGVAIATFDSASADALDAVARAELATLRDACLRFRADTNRLPENLVDLTVSTVPAYVPDPFRSFDPNTRKGWRGPYLAAFRTVTVTATQIELADPWSRTDRPSYYQYAPAATPVPTITAVGADGLADPATAPATAKDDIQVTIP